MTSLKSFESKQTLNVFIDYFKKNWKKRTSVLVKQAKSKIEKNFSETPFEKSKKKSRFSFNIGQKKVESDEKDFDLLVQR